MPVERPPTRDRILEVCRILFNERGPTEVTTADIAQTVGISEGNLHYHFRRKEQIVLALFAVYDAALERVASARSPTSSRPEPHRLYLANWFNLMWEWRFLYTASVYRLAPALQPRLRRITDYGQANARIVLAEMVFAGKLVATPQEQDRLVVNAWIVATYWIDYLRTRQGVETIARNHLDWGLAQVEALFTPHVVPYAERRRQVSSATSPLVPRQIARGRVRGAG